MKRIAVLFSLLLALLAPVPASAQMTMSGVGGGFGAAAGGAFSGPCDAVAGATVFYGFVSCSAAYATAHSAAADVCDMATCTTVVTINFLSTGYWDAATAAASAACTTACVVKQFYDSSGNAHTIPANSGQYGQVVFNVLGSCSGLTHTATYTTGPDYRVAITSVPTPYSFVGLTTRHSTAVTTQQYIIGSSSGGGAGLGFAGAANTAQVYASSTLSLSSVSDATFHAMVAINLGTASSTLNVDGTASTGNMGTQAIASIEYGSDPFGSFMQGYAVAAGLWPSAVTASTMNTNIHSLCGGF